MNKNSYAITTSYILCNKDYYSYHNLHLVYQTCPKCILHNLVLNRLVTSNIRDFRLISLLGSLYKILIKRLANRLRRVVGKVGFLDSQNAFVEGRQILDLTLIADKVLDSRVCNKIPSHLKT